MDAILKSFYIFHCQFVGEFFFWFEVNMGQDGGKWIKWEQSDCNNIIKKNRILKIGKYREQETFWESVTGKEKLKKSTSRAFATRAKK